MNDKQKKLLLFSSLLGVATGAAAVAAYATTKKLVSAALDRDSPTLMANAEKKIAGSLPGKEFMELRAAKSEELKNADTRLVEITSRDGLRLVGHYYPVQNAKRIIIAMHGWRSSWDQDFGMVADFWRNNGCSILFAEQRGQGESEGEYMSFGLAERFDCSCWINYVEENMEDDIPIYLAGISMGATTVLMTAGAPLPPRVHGIIADCGFTSPYDIWKHVAGKNLKIPYAIPGIMADEMFKKKLNMRTRDYSTLDAMQVCEVPVLFIHGTADGFVPVEMTYQNYVACAAEKRLLIVPGADHGMSGYTEPQNYEKATLDFWKEFD